MHKIFGQRCHNFQIFSGSRMLKADDHGMKGLPLKTFYGTSSRTVYRIAQKGMSDRRHVYADLVGSSGF